MRMNKGKTVATNPGNEKFSRVNTLNKCLFFLLKIRNVLTIRKLTLTTDIQTYDIIYAIFVMISYGHRIQLRFVFIL